MPEDADVGEDEDEAVFADGASGIISDRSTPEPMDVIDISFGRGTGERSLFSMVQFNAIVPGGRLTVRVDSFRWQCTKAAVQRGTISEHCIFQV